MPLSALHLLERADHLLRLVLVEPGRRLVEQQQRRFGHQRSPELDEAAAPEAQRIDRVIRDVLQTKQLERVVDSLPLLGGRLGEVEAVPPEAPGAEPGPRTDLQVVADAHAAEQLDPLEGSTQAESGSPVHRRACDVAAVEDDRAAVGSQHPEQAVEERGLPSAVRPDQRDGLARLDGQRHVVERHDAGEALRDAACVEQGHEPARLGVAATAGRGTVGGPASRPGTARCSARRLRRSSARCTAASCLRFAASRIPSGFLA